jgi:hypothetical protein
LDSILSQINPLLSKLISVFSLTILVKILKEALSTVKVIYIRT